MLSIYDEESTVMIVFLEGTPDLFNIATEIGPAHRWFAYIYIFFFFMNFIAT